MAAVMGHFDIVFGVKIPAQGVIPFIDLLHPPD